MKLDLINQFKLLNYIFEIFESNAKCSRDIENILRKSELFERYWVRKLKSNVIFDLIRFEHYSIQLIYTK